MTPHSSENGDDRITTIQVRKGVRDYLKNFKQGHESYEEMFLRLIEERRQGEMKMQEYEKAVKRLRQERDYSHNPFLPQYLPPPSIESEASRYPHIPPYLEGEMPLEPPKPEEAITEQTPETEPTDEAVPTEGSVEAEQELSPTEDGDETPMEAQLEEIPRDGWSIYRENVTLLEGQAIMVGLFGSPYTGEVAPSDTMPGLFNVRVKRHTF